MEMKPDKEGGSHAVPLSWHTHCVPAASRHFCCPAPRCLPHSGTPLGHTLRGTASPAVPDASGQLLIFFFLLCLENQMACCLVFSCGRADT